MKKSRFGWGQLGDLLEIFGRILKLPMVFLIAIFAVAKFIDALKIPDDSTKYSFLLWCGVVFMIGMGILEMLHIFRAIQKIRGGSDSSVPAPE